MEPKTFTYSAIIPVYNSAPIVGEVIARLVAFFENQKLSYEILLINDGSRDNSWEVISSAARNQPHITAINLARNYGQHTAIYCGLERSTGDFAITLDDDMQNPPEEIIHLIEKSREGHDLVFGKFREKKHSQFRNFGSVVIRQINNRIFQCPKDIVPTNFRLIRRDVVDRILSYKTAYPYITGLTLMFSSRPANAWVEHRERKEGKSNYNFYRILSLVARILFNYSVLPLRIMTSIGFAVSIFSFLIGIGLIVIRLMGKIQVEGWAGIMVMMAFFNGLIILLLGMLGEYIVRILHQVSFKEMYYVQEIAAQ